MDGISEIGAFSAVMAGICLSAAAGLRVFIPILALGLAGRFGLLPLGEQFAWMTSDPFLIVVAIAAVMEAGAYYVPIVDNMLDVLATPAALAGGTVIVSSLLPEMNPVAQWTTAALLGGGTAGTVQAATVLTRGTSTVTTAGLGNPLLATGETGGSLLAVSMALLVPVIFGLLVIVGLIALLVWLVSRLWQPRQPTEALDADRRSGSRSHRQGASPSDRQ